MYFPRIGFTIVIVASSLLCAAARAENLIDIFRLAAQSDPQLLSAQAEYDAQLQTKPLALGALLPRITLTGSVWRNSKDYQGTLAEYPVFNAFNVNTESRARWDPNGAWQYDTRYLTLQLYQPIFDMNAIAGYRYATRTVLRAELHYRLAQQDMLMRVADRYLNVLLSGSALNLARAEKNAISLQYQAAKHKFDVGLIAVTDVYEVKARFDHAVAQEIIAENALAAAREDLRELTGVLHNSLLVLKPDAPLIAPSPSNIDTWTTTAITQNLRVRAAEHEADAAQMAISRERAAYYPTVGLTASHVRSSSSQPYAAYQTQETSVGIDISLNLFQGGMTQTRINQAQSNHEKALQELEHARRDASKQTRNAFLGVLAGISLVTALRQAVISNEAAYKSTAAGFELGTRASLEVLNIQQELYRSQREYANARIDYILNTLRLKLNVGMLTVDDLEQINAWLG
ncbi:MAG: TolC family outer membrane protein [Pseudomonadota bacterium]